MHTTQPCDPPADDLDAAASEAAAEAPWPPGVVERPGAPAAGLPGLRPRTRLARPLSFVPIPEPGAAATPAPAPAGPARLRFVPMDTPGECPEDAGPTVLPLRPAGWSEREPGWRGRSGAATDLVLAGTPEPAEAVPSAAVAGAVPGRPGRTRLVVVGTISVIVLLCSTALLRHLVERRTGAAVPPAVVSGAREEAPVPAGASGSTPLPQPSAETTPAPPSPPAAVAPAGPLSTPGAVAPRTTPPPTPSPRPTPASPAPEPSRAPAPSLVPSPVPVPHPSWNFGGSTGVTNACHGGVVDFGGCTYTVTAGAGGTLSAVVGADPSSSLKLKIRDAAGHALAIRYLQPGEASLSLAVGPGSYRVTVQELTSRTSSFTLVVSLS